MQHAAQRHDYAVLVADVEHSVELERRQVERLRAQRVDAIVLAGEPRDPSWVVELRQAGMVVIDPDSATGGRRTQMTPDGSAFAALCDELQRLGHRRLGYVARTARPTGRRLDVLLRGGGGAASGSSVSCSGPGSTRTTRRP